MKLSDFAHGTEYDYLWLKRRLDGLPYTKTLSFEDCELLPGCSPSRAAVSFFKEDLSYAVSVDRNIHFTGQNRAMSMFGNGQPIYFRSFDEMRDFFRELASKTNLQTLNNSGIDGYDLNNIVNINEVTIPAKAVKSIPDHKTIQQELEKYVIGQETATLTIAHQASLHLQKSNPKKPLSIVAYGSPGTGKSEAAKALSNILSKFSDNQYQNVWTDLNTYTEAHSVYRLIGSPPGYLGYDDTPVFEAVTKNPYTIFIFDELDKAHPEVLKTFMSILDEGRCTARKELADHSREYDFKHCIFIFTSNYRLNAPAKKQGKIGFTFSDDVENIQHSNDGVTIGYTENKAQNTEVSVTNQIYRNTESARKTFVEAGVLREIASRFSCFIEFKDLSSEAKIRILAKQVVETGFEYNVQLAYISPTILQSLINASTTENALTVRSFKSVIEGYLAAVFAETGANCGNKAVRLEGTLESPALLPA